MLDGKEGAELLKIYVFIPFLLFSTVLSTRRMKRNKSENLGVDLMTSRHKTFFCKHEATGSVIIGLSDQKLFHMRSRGHHFLVVAFKTNSWSCVDTGNNWIFTGRGDSRMLSLGHWCMHQKLAGITQKAQTRTMSILPTYSPSMQNKGKSYTARNTCGVKQSLAKSFDVCPLVLNPPHVHTPQSAMRISCSYRILPEAYWWCTGTSAATPAGPGRSASPEDAASRCRVRHQWTRQNCRCRIRGFACGLSQAELTPEHTKSLGSPTFPRLAWSQPWIWKTKQNTHVNNGCCMEIKSPREMNIKENLSLKLQLNPLARKHLYHCSFVLRCFSHMPKFNIAPCSLLENTRTILCFTSWLQSREAYSVLVDNKYSLGSRNKRRFSCGVEKGSPACSKQVHFDQVIKLLFIRDYWFLFNKMTW